MNAPALRFRDGEGREFPIWNETTLGKSGKISSGVGFSQSQQGGASGVPFFKVSDMNLKGNESKMTSANNYVSENQIIKNKYKIIADEAIIFAKVGAAIFLERKRQAKNFLLDNNMMAYIPRFDINFCKQYFEIIALSKYAQVGALPSYNASDLSVVKINIPSIPEQSKIAAFLTAIDQNIDHLTKKHELLETYKKGVMQKIFSQEVRFKDDEGREFPEWEGTALSALLIIPERTRPLSYDKNKLLTVKLHLNGICKNESTDSLSIGATNYYIRKAGDFIFGKQNLFNGAFGIIPCDFDGFLSSGDVPTLELVKEKLNANFFIALLEQDDYYKSLESIASGSGSKRIHEKAILDLIVKIPSIDEQIKISSLFASIDEKITAVKSQLDAAKQYKQGLLQQMFV